MSTENNFVSIVITCNSIIGIIFFNLSKTIYVQNGNQGLKIAENVLDIVVDKDAFEEIGENPGTGLEVTVKKGTIRRGMHFYSKLQSMTLETFRSNIWWLEVGCGG